MTIDPRFLALAAASLTAPAAAVPIGDDVTALRRVLAQYPGSQIETRPGPPGTPLSIRPPRVPGGDLVVEIDGEVLAALEAMTEEELDAEIKRRGLDTAP